MKKDQENEEIDWKRRDGALDVSNWMVMSGKIEFMSEN